MADSYLKEICLVLLSMSILLLDTFILCFEEAMYILKIQTENAKEFKENAFPRMRELFPEERKRALFKAS